MNNKITCVITTDTAAGTCTQDILMKCLKGDKKCRKFVSNVHCLWTVMNSESTWNCFVWKCKNTVNFA